MNRHPFDPISLVFGAAFTAMGLAFLVGRPDVGAWRAAWIWPIPLIGLGLILIVVAATRTRAERPIEVPGDEPPLPRPPEPSEPDPGPTEVFDQEGSNEELD
jgi:hypothetical protein